MYQFVCYENNIAYTATAHIMKFFFHPHMFTEPRFGYQIIYWAFSDFYPKFSRMVCVLIEMTNKNVEAREY